MPELTAEQIAQAAFDRDLIDENRLREIWGELGSRDIDPEQFKQFLLRRELVTNYQLERLLKGERTGFYYGQYRILYQVGSGTFARVYRATHRETGQVRAVKVLRKRYLDDQELRDQFIREGEMGCTLRHPNIVPIYEVISQPAACFLVMEFIEGRNLREFLKIRQQFEPLEATKLALDICRGLDYAFQRGISHRDLKSSNVLVSSLGQAKLVDFGLAGADPTASEAELASIENPRTIDYAALERASGVRKDDNRSDIFFLGCIYYHMLSGRPALEETKDRIARLSRQRFEAMTPIIKLMPSLPKDVAAVVSKATQIDPQNRYQTPGEMANDLALVAERLASGDGSAHVVSSLPTKQRTVMLVEPNLQLQQALRDALKRKGFRVLVTADAQRPASLFSDSKCPADCVLFSTSTLGEESLEAFNEFGATSATREVPAILLLGAKHQSWSDRAKTCAWRATATTPIKMKELLGLLDELVPVAKA